MCRYVTASRPQCEGISLILRSPASQISHVFVKIVEIVYAVSVQEDWSWCWKRRCFTEKGRRNMPAITFLGLAILVTLRQIVENITVEPFEQSYQSSVSSSSNEKV